MPALNQTTYNHNYQQHVPLPPPVSSQPLTQQNVPQQIQPQRSGSAQTPQFAPVSASSRQPVGNMQTRQAAPQVLVQQKLPFPKGEEQYTKFKGQYIFCTNGSPEGMGRYLDNLNNKYHCQNRNNHHNHNQKLNINCNSKTTGRYKGF